MKIGKIFLLIFMFLGIIFLTIFVSGFKTDYLNIIETESNNFSLNKNLVLAIIKTESKFDKNAVSSAGAIGLMQVIPSTGVWIAEKLNVENFKIDDLYNEEINIKFGCFYLKYLFDRFEDESVVICAYNAGPNLVASWLLDENYSKNNKTLLKTPYEETNNYLTKVKFNN